MWKKAFTLVELLVVLAIIAILIGTLTAVVSGQRGSARDSKRLAEVDGLRKGLELYYTGKKKYPEETTWCCIGAKNTEPEVCDNFATEMKPYFPIMPRDPLYPTIYDPLPKIYCYHYISTANAQIYKIHVMLENGSDYHVYSRGGKDIPLPYLP